MQIKNKVLFFIKKIPKYSINIIILLYQATQGIENTLKYN